MKGVIPNCLGKLIKSKYGDDQWELILDTAGFPKYTTFPISKDIPDESVIKVVESACKILNITLQQAADAFGDYWVNDYAPKIYHPYFDQSKTAKEFLLNMDDVHKSTTQDIANAHPPRFDYSWKDDKTLIMTYKSDRGLIEFLIGLIKGVGKYYNDELQVTQLANDKVQVVFG